MAERLHPEPEEVEEPTVVSLVVLPRSWSGQSPDESSPVSPLPPLPNVEPGNEDDAVPPRLPRHVVTRTTNAVTLKAAVLALFLLVTFGYNLHRLRTGVYLNLTHVQADGGYCGFANKPFYVIDSSCVISACPSALNLVRVSSACAVPDALAPLAIPPDGDTEACNPTEDGLVLARCDNKSPNAYLLWSIVVISVLFVGLKVVIDRQFTLHDSVRGRVSDGVVMRCFVVVGYSIIFLVPLVNLASWRSPDVLLSSLGSSYVRIAYYIAGTVVALPIAAVVSSPYQVYLLWKGDGSTHLLVSNASWSKFFTGGFAHDDGGLWVLSADFAAIVVFLVDVVALVVIAVVNGRVVRTEAAVAADQGGGGGGGVVVGGVEVEEKGGDDRGGSDLEATLGDDRDDDQAHDDGAEDETMPLTPV